MKSLKAALPELATIMGSTPAALYERQRALARLGLLTAVAGRGPGSGAPLSADNVAALLIALAVTDNLSDTNERVEKLCRAKPQFKSACPFTAATSFQMALSAVLSSPKLAKQTWALSVDRNELSALILYRPRIRVLDSPFVQPRGIPVVWCAIRTHAFLDPNTIRAAQRIIEHSNDGTSENLGGAE